jgi:hypothetical protein
MAPLNDRQFYGMGHSPGEEGPPVHELAKHYPDIHDHPEYYGSRDQGGFWETVHSIDKARSDRPLHPRPAHDPIYFSSGKQMLPASEGEGEESFSRRVQKRQSGEHRVTVFRSAPRGAGRINTGDWVSLSPTYAHNNGLHPTDNSQNMPTFKAQVPAKHVRWAEDDINEFGYFGPGVKAITHRRGGRNAPRIGD